MPSGQALGCASSGTWSSRMSKAYLLSEEALLTEKQIEGLKDLIRDRAELLQ